MPHLKFYLIRLDVSEPFRGLIWSTHCIVADNVIRDGQAVTQSFNINSFLREQATEIRNLQAEKSDLMTTNATLQAKLQEQSVLDEKISDLEVTIAGLQKKLDEKNKQLLIAEQKVLDISLENQILRGQQNRCKKLRSAQLM